MNWTLAGNDRKLVDMLEAAGIARKDDCWQKIIIEISCDDAVKIYVQRLGDERLYDVDWRMIAECVEKDKA